MEIKRVKEILKERGFVIDKTSCVKEEDYTDEVYTKGEEFVNIYINPQETDVFISNPRYNFRTDVNERRGINLTNIDEEYKLTEENFIYCLDIQEDPRLHEIKILKSFLKLSEWLHNSFEPVAKTLGLELGDGGFSTVEITDDFFPMDIFYNYYFDDDSTSLSIELNPLTTKVIIEVDYFKTDLKPIDFNFIYGEPPEFIYSALEEIQEQIKNSSAGT